MSRSTCSPEPEVEQSEQGTDDRSSGPLFCAEEGKTDRCDGESGGRTPQGGMRNYPAGQ